MPPSSGPASAPLDPAEPADPVELLLAECMVESQSDVAERVEDACRRAPEHAVELRSRFRLLQDMGIVGEPAPEEPPAIPDRLGGFRLLRRLGGGGMGVVYLAHEEALDRTVALKLIRPEHLYFPQALERFRREVKIVSGLQHPGIVPVYAVGEAQGIPYFTMECVAGANLQQLLASLEGRPPARLTGADLTEAMARLAPEARQPGPEDARSAAGTHWQEVCLELVLQAAEALAYVHGHGVLHRDLKPSNLMVTPQGRVMLVDFGLSSSSNGAARLTRSGGMAGSLAYMSPEQLAGRAARLDARTDVYSLGVTLYELLCLVSPFLGADAEDTRRRILTGEVVPLRERNRAITWDAETVCQKAMDRDPARRYASAGELARDLRNVLEFRPIAAQRPGLWLRARRFAQRRPATTVALALGSLILLGAPSAWAVVQHQSAVRAEASLQETIKAVYQSLLRVATVELDNVPQADRVRRALLQDALDLCSRMRRENPTNWSILATTADVLGKAGHLQGQLGDRAAAERSLTEAIGIYSTLPGRAGTSIRAVSELATAEQRLAGTLLASGRPEEAETWSRRALTHLQELKQRFPEDAGIARIVAGAWSNLAIVLERRPAESEPAIRTAVELLEELATRQPDEETLRFLAQALDTLGFVLRRDRPEEAVVVVRRAMAIAQQLVDRSPEHEEYLWKLGNTQSKLGDLLRDLREPEQAEVFQRAALATREKLMVLWPGRVAFQSLAAYSLNNVASLRMQQGDHAQAHDLLVRAIELQRRVLELSPGLVSAREFLHIHRLNLAHCLVALERPHEVLALASDPDTGAVTSKDLLCRAELLCLCIDAGVAIGGLEEEQRDALATRAVACLRRAVDAGMHDRPLRETRFAALRGRPEFRKLLAEARSSPASAPASRRAAIGR